MPNSGITVVLVKWHRQPSVNDSHIADLRLFYELKCHARISLRTVNKVSTDSVRHAIRVDNAACAGFDCKIPGKLNNACKSPSLKSEV